MHAEAAQVPRVQVDDTGRCGHWGGLDSGENKVQSAVVKMIINMCVFKLILAIRRLLSVLLASRVPTQLRNGLNVQTIQFRSYYIYITKHAS